MTKVPLIARAAVAAVLLAVLVGPLLSSPRLQLDETRHAIGSFVRQGSAVVEGLSRRVQERLSQSVEKMFARLDTNGDGALSLGEFRGVELSFVAILEDARTALPSLPGVDIDARWDMWQIVKRFVAAHMIFIVAMFLIENLRVLFDNSNPFPCNSDACAGIPPHASVEEALRYDTPLTLYERLKMAFFILTLHVFIRAFLVVTSLVVAALFASGAMLFSRNSVISVLALKAGRVVGFMALIFMGYFHIRVFGKPSTDPFVKLVIGNHVCAVELVFLFLAMNLPSFVSRIENSGIPLFGTIVELSDAIVVTRDAAASRQKTIEAIRSRAGNPNAKTTMIFPEGTCNNNRALFMFRTGAFRPGKPVQLVAFKYRYTHFNPAWTGRITGGNDPLDLVARLLCQFVNRLDVCFGPEYHPTPEEIADPVLYAAKCQRILANMLGCATSDATLASYVELQKKMPQSQ